MNGKTLPRNSLVHVGNGEATPDLRAGASGADILLVSSRGLRPGRAPIRQRWQRETPMHICNAPTIQGDSPSADVTDRANVRHSWLILGSHVGGKRNQT